MGHFGGVGWGGLLGEMGKCDEGEEFRKGESNGFGLVGMTLEGNRWAVSGIKVGRKKKRGSWLQDRQLVLSIETYMTRGLRLTDLEADINAVTPKEAAEHST